MSLKIEKDDILRLGHLARIKIGDDEVDSLQRDISAVLDYVSVVNEIVADDISREPGALSNVFRPDVITNKPGTHTDVLLQAAPAVKDSFLVVKKILNND